MRHELSKFSKSIITPRVLLAFLIIAYIGFFSALTILRHRTLNSHAWDLGFYDQTLWNTAQGQWFACTLKPGITTKMADHFQPTLLPLAATYLIHSSPETLLVVSTIILALGALPTYLLARTRLHNEYLAVVFAGAYLLYPSLQAANMNDFHAVALAAPFLLFALYFLQIKNARRAAILSYFICLILALGTREDIALSVIAIGIYAILMLKKRALGGATIILGAGWFILTIGFIVPYFNPEGASPHSGYYDYLGASLGEIALTVLTRPRYIWTIITAPQKLKFLAQILVPLAFLPLGSPASAAMGGAALLLNLLSSAENMHSGDSYYVTPLIPFLFFSAIYGAGNLLDLARRAVPQNKDAARVLICAIGVVVSLSSLGYQRYHGYTPLYAGFSPPRLTAHHRLLRQFAARIPPAAPLAVQSDLAPHFSQRAEVHVFPLAIDRVEYVLLDVTSRPYPLSNRRDLQEVMMSIMAEYGFALSAAQDGYILLHRAAAPAPSDTPALPPEFYTFAHASITETAQLDYPMRVAYGDALTLLGYNVVPDRDCEFALDLYWRVTGNTGLDYDVDFWLHDAAGNVHWRIGAYLPHWYPTSRWQDGAVIRLSSPTFTGVPLKAGFITLQLPEAKNDAHILHPRVQESALFLPAPRHGAALRMFDFECRRGILRSTPPLRRYTTPQVSHPLSVSFGDQITLNGYEISQSPLRGGDELQFTLYWQAAAAPLKFYNVFVHVCDAAGARVLQHDAPPQDGAYPTSWWARGEVVADTRRVPIPVGMAPGEYTVWIGVYELETMARLPAGGADVRIEADAVRLLTFEVLE